MYIILVPFYHALPYICFCFRLITHAQFPFLHHSPAVGRQLLQQIPPTHIDAVVFTIVDQMNRGSRKLTDHNEELIVAQLNLKAGEKAMANSSFLQASIYLAQGTVLIRDEDWTTHYNLCLRLFTICAESQLAHADYDGAILAINHVLSNGKTVEDKLRAYHACAIAFIAQAKTMANSAAI